jgi:hypothetical protein
MFVTTLQSSWLSFLSPLSKHQKHQQKAYSLLQIEANTSLHDILCVDFSCLYPFDLFVSIIFSALLILGDARRDLIALP